jgi:hypothetical protein
MGKTAVRLSELVNALMFLGRDYEHAAYVSLDTGEVHIAVDEEMWGEFPVPDDLETSDRYLRLPDKRELGLDRRLALAFIEAAAPDDYDRVRGYFSRRGAYARFKNLLEFRNLLDRWYAYEQEAEADALRAWCAENDLTVTE